MLFPLRMDDAAKAGGAQRPNAWLGAFAHPAFAVVWTASTCALIGIAMYDTASGWLMTTLDLDPFDVSLLRTATTLPMFLFTLPAGAIADVIDARRMIIVVSYVIAALMAVFAAVVALDFTSPLILLLTTFVLSAAWSLNSPAWLSIVPLLVPKDQVSGATAANGVGYNVSRTVGPALGGLLIARFGAAAPFWIFVAANLGVIAALTWWRAPTKQRASLPAERFSSAMRTGLRHAANNRLLWATMARTLAIYPFSSAYWGLLPLIARHTGEGAEHYGLILSAISVGTILGSFANRGLRKRLSSDWIVAVGTVLTAIALTIFAFSHELVLALSAGLIAGVAWVTILTCLFTSAQNVLPDWVRGRGLAVFLTVIFGTMTLGSAAWGDIAAKIGTQPALLLAAAGALLAIPLTWRWKLQQEGAAIDLSPSHHWALPKTEEQIDHDSGPVLVKIEYRIDPADRAAFLRALDELGFERRRDGAFAWGIFEDAGAEGRFEETYLIETWLELMHLRERVTNADRMLEEEIREMLIAAPRLEFLIGVDRTQRARRSPEQPAGA
jgi:predicted MFS family arabinose efflux permease